MKNANSIQNVNIGNVVLLSHSYRNLPPAKNSKSITVNYSHSNQDYYINLSNCSDPRYLENGMHNSKHKS